MGSIMGRVLLFFGVRNEKKDYLYQKEFEFFEKDEEFNFFIHPAFSRDQENKVYVQNKIKENSKIVSELIEEENVYLILVGNSKILPKYVDKTIAYCLKGNSSERFKEFKDEDYLKYLN